MQREELNVMKASELKKLAKELHVHVGNKKKGELVEAIYRFTHHKNEFMDIDLQKR